MNVLQRVEPLLAHADPVVRQLRCAAPLLTRLVFGVAFFHAGLGKWHHFDRTVAFFDGLGIPAPAANAALVSTVEVLGGAALILGLLTRVFATLLASTMIVALMTAHRGDIAEAFTKAAEKGLTDIPALVFLLAMLGLIAFGPGRLALDHVMPWGKRSVT
jgi:putative oxidoreductase